MRQKKIATLLLAGLLLLQVGCGQEGQSSAPSEDAPNNAVETMGEQNLVTPFRLAIYTAQPVNPMQTDNRANLSLSALLYEGLFALDNDFQAALVLCQSYQAQEDYRRWHFTLRPDITFSDGTPLTGEHVAAALEQARKPQSRYASRLGEVTDISAQEDSVSITLKTPNANLPALLDVPIVLGEGERPLGTGPYVLTQGETLTLSAREGWWQGKSLPLDEIPLQEMSKSEEMIFAFDAGNISLVDVDMMGTNALGYSGNYEIWSYPTTNFLYIAFNTTDGPCKNVQLRQALALAVDRESIAQSIYARHAVPAALPVHPNSPLYDDQLAQAAAYRPVQAALILTEAMVQGSALTLLVNNENPAKLSAAQHIADQFVALGLEVTVDKRSFQDYLTALKAGEFDLYLGEVALGADFDLSALIAPYGALNYGTWQDWQMTGLLETLAGSGEETRPQAAAAVFQRLLQQAPIVPIAFKNGAILTKWGQLSGLAPVRANPFAQMELWQVNS